MTVEGALPFPGSRTLASWGRQLASWQPGALWVGHILLHRVEALVRRTVAVQLEPFQALVLKALAVRPAQSLQELQAHLHLDRQLLEGLLQALHRAGLAHSESGWQTTDLGVRALGQGAHARDIHERQTFYFVEKQRSEGPPHFLALVDPPTQAWPAGSDWRFDVELLSACVKRPVDWKRRFGFPLDVEEIVRAAAVPGAPDAESWRRVVFDRPERLVAVLARIPAERGDRLLGFQVRQDGWTLMSEKPVFAVGEGWGDVFPELASGVAEETWRDALQAWCQTHGVAEAEANALQITPEGLQLRIRAPATLLSRLRSQREAAWLLAGTARLRAMAALYFEESATESR